jgi:hypothetical protein
MNKTITILKESPEAAEANVLTEKAWKMPKVLLISDVLRIFSALVTIKLFDEKEDK